MSVVRRGYGRGCAGCVGDVSRCRFDTSLTGVHAVLIDKKKKPQWNPATLSEVSKELVERFVTDTPPRSPLTRFFLSLPLSLTLPLVQK